MNIIQEYIKLTEEITVLQSKIITAHRELQKAINTYKPDGYTKGSNKPNKPIIETGKDIYSINIHTKELEQELRETRAQRDQVEKTINDLGDTKKNILMYKIKGYSLSKIAFTMNYSKRHVQRLWNETKDVIEMSQE